MNEVKSMIKSVAFKNYKSFKKGEIHFGEELNLNNHFSFIYGENGSGKSNLISIFNFLKTSLITIKNNERFIKLASKLGEMDEQDEIMDFLKYTKMNQRINLKNIIEHEKLLFINSKEDIELELKFKIDNKNATYYMKLNPKDGIVEEKLNYLVSKNVGELFHIKYDNDEIISNCSPKLFTNEYGKQINELVEKYWGNHTFLSIIHHEFTSDEKNKSYLHKSINKNLLAFLTYISRISVDYKGSEYRAVSKVINNEIFENIEKGSISVEAYSSKKIAKIEKIINFLFKSLYTDIMKVFFKTEQVSNEIKYELIFRKKIFEETVDVPASNESSGTKKILELVPFLICLVDGMIVIVDEIDSEIHDLLMKVIIEGFSEIDTGQLIATTHNTLLLKTLNKRNVFVIDVDSDANKEIINLGNHNHKLQNTNSLYSQYLQGNFGGIPYVEYLDADYFKELSGVFTDDQEK